MEAIGSSTPSTTARSDQRSSARPAAGIGVEDKGKTRAATKSAVRQNESTGGRAALAVNDLSRKPQPAWGNDPFNTRMHLEQDRLFAKSDTGSARSAMRMYNSVAHF